MKTGKMPIVEPLEAKASPSSGLAGSGLAEKLTVSRSTAIPGEPIALTATLTNVSRHDVTVTEGPSREGFAVSRGGREVWSSDEGTLTAMFLVEDTLHPGESIDAHATWSGQVAPGAEATGTFRVTSAFLPGGAGAKITISPAHDPGHRGH